jgi:Fur family ferric uptake transcriptional regulator
LIYENSKKMAMDAKSQAYINLPIGHNHRPLPCKEKAPEKIIRQMGLKVTQQRRALIKAIQGVKAHLTAQEVHDIVRIDHPEMGFATVYRFLRILSDMGFISEIRVGRLPARYEWAGKKHHDHLTCTQCGLICEFENDQIENLQQQVAQRLGFQLTGHVLELFGLCPQCQNKALDLKCSQGTP